VRILLWVIVWVSLWTGSLEGVDLGLGHRLMKICLELLATFLFESIGILQALSECTSLVDR
jgi:hypothetical protein